MSYIQIPQLKPLYPSHYHKDFRELLNFVAETYKESKAFILKHKNKGEVSYENISFRAFRDDAFAIGTAMLKKGWHGKRIAVVGPNSYNWMATFFATLGGVGTTVPLDRGLPYEELESSLARSYADVLVFDETTHKEMVEKLKADGKTLVKEYISMKELEGYENLNDLREQGKKALEEGFEEYKTVPIDENAVTILLFTSGTTSMSKAVMLSQQNILSNVKAMEATENFIHGDINMAFLPYHHTFGSVGQTVMLACGVATAYCDGLKYLQKNLVEYKVSVFFCVPLLIESIYKKVMQTVKKQGKEKTLATGIKISQFLLKFGIDIRRKLFKEILDQLGGNLRLVISGAAAIDPEAIKGFNNLGISAVQGFGMTEASPVISAENDKEHALGSCGHAMLGVDLRIDNPDENGVGELIAKGPNIMAGYYENEEETAKTLVDGWLHTGDLAYADDKGYVYICGRKKNVIVLKNGKNVYPEEIEVMISNLDYVEECMVFGQPRKADDPIDLAVCLKVVYNPNVMKETYGATTLEEVEKVVREDVDKINDTMPTYKQITKIIVTDEEMIKTTTGKVKRFEETKKL